MTQSLHLYLVGGIWPQSSTVTDQRPGAPQSCLGESMEDQYSWKRSKVMLRICDVTNEKTLRPVTQPVSGRRTSAPTTPHTGTPPEKRREQTEDQEGERRAAVMSDSTWAACGEPHADVKDEDEEDDLVDSRRLEAFMRDRRRARSLPAYPEQEALLQELSDGTGSKRVKFADSLGLSLASVKLFSAMDEPRVPVEALSRLTSRHAADELCAGVTSGLVLDRRAPTFLQPGGWEDFRRRVEDRLVPTFPQPGGREDFRQRVETLRVSLESVSVSQHDVRGQIRVSCGGAEREVGVRYTFNDWLSYVDAQALPVPADRTEPRWFGERFSFTMYTPPVASAASVHFAVYVRSDAEEFWDNNQGHNYTLQCRRASGTTSTCAAAPTEPEPVACVVRKD